ncbi:hypothetical protein [Paenarthrobacter sp. YIM B13468]|uniref:hypothetical protein n=1 Tax=Paenarthrobacter sp. YIM B13468 TaxID=3366295 RepID=UPI003670D2CD
MSQDDHACAVSPPSFSVFPHAFRALLRSCGTDEHLLIETIETIRQAPGSAAGLIHVEYRCQACGFSRSHAAEVADVADVLTRSDDPNGVLQFGRHHLHCGVPMHTGPGKLHLISSGATGRTDPELETYLNTRVLHCDECGFQMEIPE